MDVRINNQRDEEGESDMDWDVWGLPLVVLGASVAVGIFVAFRDQDQSIQRDKESDLEAQKSQIMEQNVAAVCGLPCGAYPKEKRTSSEKQVDLLVSSAKHSFGPSGPSAPVPMDTEEADVADMEH